LRNPSPEKEKNRSQGPIEEVSTMRGMIWNIKTFEDILPYIIGSLGWVINGLHFAPEYLTYGGAGMLAHLAEEERFLQVSVLLTIPVFMVAGYLLKRQLLPLLGGGQDG